MPTAYRPGNPEDIPGLTQADLRDRYLVGDLLVPG